MRRIVVLIGWALATSALAQESDHYQLKLHTFNAGGNPAGGAVPSSLNYRIALDAIGDAIPGIPLGSPSFRLAGCFVGTYPFLPAASAGRVADDGCLSPSGEPTLQVTRDAVTGDLTLSWGASCQGSDNDYEVYESAMMGPSATQGFSPFTHTARYCTTGGLLSKTFAAADPVAPAIGNYYLVVPTNGAREGSYGGQSPGACDGERPVGTVQCVPQQVGVCP